MPCRVSRCAAALLALFAHVATARVDERRTPWERVVGHAERPRTTWRDPDGGQQDAFPGLAFGATLSRRGAENVLAGAGLALDQLLDAAERLEDVPRELPLRRIPHPAPQRCGFPPTERPAWFSNDVASRSESVG